MYYLLAGTLGFLLCGAWFGTQLWLKQLFSRRGREGLVPFAPLLAACPPMLLRCWRGLYGPRGPALPQLWLWLLSGPLCWPSAGSDAWAAGRAGPLGGGSWRGCARRPRWWKSRSGGCCRFS